VVVLDAGAVAETGAYRELFPGSVPHRLAVQAGVRVTGDD
jgi:hypothetical protein